MTAVQPHRPTDEHRDRSTVNARPADPPAAGHEFDRVEERDGGFVLCCACGWESGTSRSAEAVGTDWDRHRMEVGASNW
jgi:hypothetical protein